jgi:hypothetical protein
MNAKELEKILTEHAEWSRDTTKGKRANLTGAIYFIGGRKVSF